MKAIIFDELAQDAENFDDFSTAEVENIAKARERVSRGDYTAFANFEEMAEHFGV